MSRIDLVRVGRHLAVIVALFASVNAGAGLTDLSDVPLASSANQLVKPNVLFVLDDSASMGWEYMPDLVGRKAAAEGVADPDPQTYVGFRNPVCNLVYYNPATNYVIPKTSLGGPINPASASTDWGNTPSTYTAALDDGFYFFNSGTLTTVNLSTSFKAHQSDTAQPAYYWMLDSSAASTPLEPRSKSCVECLKAGNCSSLGLTCTPVANCATALSSAGDSTSLFICANGTRTTTSGACTTAGSTVRWKKVLVSSTSGTGSTDERLNFANWYSYYRTRLNMMKSASGRSIVPLSEAYRVGFITIDPGSPVDAGKFLAVNDFNTVNKANWFKKLYSQRVNDITPLRKALSRAGRYYAGKVNDGINLGIADDPVTDSCQQNFTILTTDGYWNGAGGNAIDNSVLNTNQDGDLTELDAYNDAAKKFLVSPRPIYDGSVRYSWKSALADYQDSTGCSYAQAQRKMTLFQTRTIQTQKKTIQNQTRTTQLQTRTTQLQQRSLQNQQRSIQNQKRTVQNQTRNTQLQKKTTQLQQKTTQLQSRSIQNQKRTIQNQSKTTQLQTRTTQLQRTTTQLQQKTTQLQSRSIQNQKRTIQNQSKTTQLQTRTTQLQKTTTQLQKKTTQLQSRSIQNQKRTIQNQSKSTQLQTRTTQLQKTTTQLQKKTTQLQSRSIQTQSKTTQLQKKTLQLQKRTARFRACSGASGTGSCVDLTFDCTSSTGDGSKPYCYVTGDTGWTNVSATTCTPSSTETSQTICRTYDPGWVSAGTCTAASINASGQTIQCQTYDPGWVNVGTCTAAGINGSGQTLTCQVASDSGWVNAATCAAATPSTGPAVTCNTVDPGWVNSGTCTAAGLNGSGQTVTCQTLGPTTANAGTCSVTAIDGSGLTVTACTTTSPTWTNTGSCTAGSINTTTGTTVQCQTYDPGWLNVAACTPASINGSGVTVTCQEASNSGWVNIGTCAASNPSTGPTVTCQVGSDSGWVSSGTCTAANPASGPTITCNTVDPGWVNSGTCSAAGINGSGQTVTCQTLGPTTANAGTCAVTSIDGNGLTVTACTTTSPTWNNTGSCTPGTINTTTGTTVQCQTTNPAWVNVGTCTPASINGSGVTVTCQVASDSGWVNIGTCAASNPSTGPTVTCQVLSDSGMANASTCVASNPASGPTVTCNTVDPGWVNSGTCTGAGINGSGQTVTCQTLGPTIANAGTCTVALIDSNGLTVTACTTTNPTWNNTGSCTPGTINTTTGQTVECQTTNPAWVNVGTCTPASINGSGATVTCQVASDSGWVPIGTCAASNPSTGPTVTCQVISDTGMVNSGTCVASNPAAGPTVTCNTVDPGWVNAATCSAAGINGSGQTVTCNTVDPGWVNASTCVAAGINGSGQTVTCQTTSPVWSNIGTCTPVAINGSGVTTECQVVSDSGWGNIGTCAASNPSTGPTVTCQVGSDSGWVNIGTCSAANPAAGPTVTCQVGSDSGFVNAGSCTAGNPAAGPTVTCQTTNPGWSNTGSCTVASINGLGQTVECQTSNGAWANSGTCTPAAINGSGVITECQETSNSGWENIATCAASNPSTGPTITCQTSSDSGWVSTGSCTPSAPAAGPVVTCNPVSDTGWVNVSACTPDASALPPVECQTVTKNDGHQLQYRTTQTEQIYQGAAQTGTLFSTATGSASAWANSGSCSATLPTIPASGPVEPSGAQLALPSGCAAWPCQTAINTYGSANSLADVAQYYYKTELRPLSSFGACNSPVKALGTGTEDDKATWQHMTTFTLGLGVSGTLTYQADYKSSSTGAFAGLRAGTVDWPVPVIDTNSVDGDLVEPKYAVDDLWHAAVNGRGQYFSAGRPEDVVSGLGTALSAIDADKASAAGVAVSSQQLLASGNMAYLTSYVTKKWTGDVQAYELNPQTGDPGATVIWDAQLKLDAATKNACDNRTIKLFRQGATDNLVDFSLGTYLCDSAGAPTGSPVTGLNSAEQDYFSAALITGQVQSKPALSQVASMTDTQKAAAAGAKLINYLRGQRGNETFIIGNDAKLFRARDHVLGDIVYAAPQLVAAPFAGYDDKGYAAYKVAQAARTSMLYVAANDGMLHAFRAGTSTTDATGGTEAWAFIPSMVLPNLYKLAGESYSSEHIFLVDGTPTAGDICSSNCTTNAAVWKTILVGGLRKGGKGYYALDVTNPDSPKALWEFKSGACFDSSSVSDQFTDCHIGYSYGAPLIAKLRDGRWAVFVSSGYNNVNSPTVTGDGMGYLFVLDAVTGKIIYKISTNTGSATTPSGLVNLNGRSTSPLRNNTADYIYGTDLLGNIWRFDVNDLILPNGIEATLLATLLDTQGLAQAITTTPAVGEVNGEPYVYVATGRYLGSSDLQLPDPIQKQTIWGIKDPLSDSAVIDLRATLKKVTTATVGTDANAYRTNSCVSSVLDHCNSTAGWYLDLPEDGERVNIDMKLELGTLIVASNVPPVCRCEIGGTSWLNYVDATQGTAVNTSTNVVTGTRPKDAQGKPTQVVGLNVIRTVTGEVKVLATTRQGTIEKPQIPIMAPQVVGKRVSWLEIVE